MPDVEMSARDRAAREMSARTGRPYEESKPAMPEGKPKGEQKVETTLNQQTAAGNGPRPHELGPETKAAPKAQIADEQKQAAAKAA